MLIERAPSGYLEFFSDLEDEILNYPYQPNLNYLIFGDLNVNFLAKSTDTLRRETLMNTSNLMKVVNFPKRTGNNKGKLIDNIFLDTTKYDKIKVKHFINGLADHDTQIFSLKNINISLQKNEFETRIGLINEQTINFLC